MTTRLDPSVRLFAVLSSKEETDAANPCTTKNGAAIQLRRSLGTRDKGVKKAIDSCFRPGVRLLSYADLVAVYHIYALRQRNGCFAVYHKRLHQMPVKCIDSDLFVLSAEVYSTLANLHPNVLV